MIKTTIGGGYMCWSMVAVIDCGHCWRRRSHSGPPQKLCWEQSKIHSDILLWKYGGIDWIPQKKIIQDWCQEKCQKFNPANYILFKTDVKKSVKSSIPQIIFYSRLMSRKVSRVQSRKLYFIQDWCQEKFADTPPEKTHTER